MVKLSCTHTTKRTQHYAMSLLFCASWPGLNASLSKPDSPIAVTITGKKNICSSYITSQSVTVHLQSATKKAHGISSKSELILFSPHSIRVGACVLLSIMKKSYVYIKLRLRWWSDTYKDYLRDVSMLAFEHADVVQRAVLALNISPSS